MSKVLLNNGSYATYLYTDEFSRDVYKADVGKGFKMCDTSCGMESIDFHSITNCGEPIASINNFYQPSDRTIKSNKGVIS